MKYVAFFCDLLGKVCDTIEEAKKQARGIDFWLDNGTGYSSTFNCEVPESAEVMEIPDSAPTRLDWTRINAEMTMAKVELAKEIKKLKEERLGKFWALRAAYVNLNTDYEYGDTIEMTVKLKNGHHKTYTGDVCGCMVTDDGEIRPDLRSLQYPESATIISIKVLLKHDYSRERQTVKCKNCIHWHENSSGYLQGFCDVLRAEVDGQKKNQECYERDASRKWDW